MHIDRLAKAIRKRQEASLNLAVDVIQDGEYLILPQGAVEALRIVLATPFARLSDGAVKPKNMEDALNKVWEAGYSIGYRRAASREEQSR